MPNEPEKIEITTEFIRLDSAMKLAGCVETGGDAKFYVQNGEVNVNGEICTQRTKKLRPRDSFEYENSSYIISGVE